MNTSKVIHWGIVSTGRISEKFCEDMRFVSNGKLAAVAARRLADAQAFAATHGIENAYEGYQTLFDDPNIDIVYIATPHNFHFEQTKAALMAGKSVLCEKPITVSAAQCIELQTLAKEKGLFLMEAMWTYFLPAVQKAKQWVYEGRIGKIIHIKADFGYPVPYEPEDRMHNPKLAGGCLFDMGIYPLAIAHFFHPAPLTNVSIQMQYAESGVDNDLAILAKANDVTLSLATSFKCRLQNAALIIGDKGYIKLPDFWRAKSCSLFVMDSLQDEFIDSAGNIGYCHEARAAGDMLLDGKKEHPRMPLSTSLLLQQHIELIREKFLR